MLYKTILYPRYFSPLRHIPGPPLGDPIFGQSYGLFIGEAGIAHRQWVRDYGPVVRAVSVFGMDGLIFTNGLALNKILVSDWLEYPRVRQTS
jgi:hypothetical protein